MPTQVAPYRQPHFTNRTLVDDMDFGAVSPRPGDSFPDFDLPTLDGGRVRLEDFVDKKPFLVTLGSASCPMTAASSPALTRLFREFNDRIEFVTFYVREAHPGENIRQPEELEEKFDNARLYERRDRIPWTVAVDGVEGEVHEQLGRHPNAAYVVDERGKVAFRSLWSSDEGPLRCGLEGVAQGLPTPIGESRRRVGPLLCGIGVMSETVKAAGRGAERDLLKQAPPLYVVGKIAGAFSPLPPMGRGIAAIGVVVGGLTLLARLLSPKDRR